MKDCPIDLHLDEDSRFALTDEEMNERLSKFKELEDKAILSRKNEKKIQNEIKRLSLRLTFAKKPATKNSLTEKINELKASIGCDYPLMTIDEAKEKNLFYDTRYNPGDKTFPEKLENVGGFRASASDRDFYFKNEHIIKSLSLFNPENPPTLYDRLAKERREYRLRAGVKKNNFYEDEILPHVSLSGWVKAVARVSRAIPTLVQLIDNELDMISKRPEELSLNGFSTVRLLERFTSRLRLKEQYLNVYVLGKEFEKILKNKFEVQVYDCFIKKSKKVKNTISPNRIRTAYRYRAVVIDKIINYCNIHGYDKEWFVRHFGELPPIKKLLTVEFEREALKAKENLKEKGFLVTGVSCGYEKEKMETKSDGGAVMRPQMSDAERIITNLKTWELLGMTRDEFYS